MKKLRKSQHKSKPFEDDVKKDIENNERSHWKKRDVYQAFFNKIKKINKVEYTNMKTIAATLTSFLYQLGQILHKKFWIVIQTLNLTITV